MTSAVLSTRTVDREILRQAIARELGVCRVTGRMMDESTAIYVEMTDPAGDRPASLTFNSAVLRAYLGDMTVREYVDAVALQTGRHVTEWIDGAMLVD